jgi:ribose transport system ATP-binding protein
LNVAETGIDPQQALVACRGVGLRFAAVTALDGVDFDVRRGEIHGLVGSNGAGKSTLMKILAGVHPGHAGTVEIGGRKALLDTPGASLAAGIAMVYQELSGIGQLSVAENLFLGRQPVTRLGRVNWGLMNEQARAFLREMGLNLDVRRRLDRYPLAVRQIVEIARGLHSGARVLILDEPTSALGPLEVERLFALLVQLRARGVAMVFISHFIEDVLAICDRVTILKDGRLVETTSAKALSKHAVIQKMLGHQSQGPEAGYEGGVALPPRTDRPPVLRACGLTLEGAFQSISLEVAPGECLGLYGFAGAGHQELAQALAGALRPTRGRAEVNGQRLKPGSVSNAIRRGVVLVAADRSRTLVRRAEVYKNVTLAHLKSLLPGWLRKSREVPAAARLLEAVGCRPGNPLLHVSQLSGGNQQKVVVARWLPARVTVLVLEEPTRGMDVGAKEEVMQLVANLKRQGAAVILASTEPELVLAHSDRILVMRRGQVSTQFAGQMVDKATLMRCA